MFLRRKQFETEETGRTEEEGKENVKALAQKTDITTFGLEGRNKSRPEIALNQFTGHDWSHSSPVHQLTRNERRLDDGKRERETISNRRKRVQEKRRARNWIDQKTRRVGR